MNDDTVKIEGSPEAIARFMRELQNKSVTVTSPFKVEWGDILPNLTRDYGKTVTDSDSMDNVMDCN